jgi:CotH kinase protein
MNTSEIPALQMGFNATHWVLLLACGAVSACTVAPGEAVGEQESSDSRSEGDPIGGSEETDSQSDPDPGSDSDSDSGNESPPSDVDGRPDDPNEQIPPPDEEGCHAIYAQDLLPTFELTVSPETWEILEWEWANGQANEDLGIDTHPYHPLAEFRYGDIVITDAKIRLRGNPSNWDAENKMQFQIGFAQYHDSGHFLGLERVLFDAAMYNRHMLRDRLSLSIMRDMGIDAPCANHARLEVNGEYYGLFTNIEKLDENFLERVFDDPTGDLWDRHNWELETNKDTATNERVLSLKNANSIEELETYLDLEQALQLYAAEAIIPNSDGPWAGGLNYFVYDDPLRGKFVILPWDLDNGLDRFNGPPDGDYPINPDPIVWEKATTHGRPWYDLALADPEWFNFYLQSIEQQVASGYQIEELHARIDAYTAQIQEAALEDTNKPYSNDLYLTKVAELHVYVQTRHDFLLSWLACWQDSGVSDQDGYCEPP